MHRRNFIHVGAVAGIAATTFGFGACNPAGESLGKDHDTMLAHDDFELDELTIHDLQERMADGRYTSRKIVELYLERIKRID
jgi:amidase